MISGDNMNYQRIAKEVILNSDKLYEEVVKCFEVTRLNFKSGSKIEFVKSGDSIINVINDVSKKRIGEDIGNISKTKIILNNPDEDVTQLIYHPRFKLEKKAFLQI